MVTSRRLEEYYYLFILSMSCTHSVKALDNLKLVIYKIIKGKMKEGMRKEGRKKAFC